MRIFTPSHSFGALLTIILIVVNSYSLVSQGINARYFNTIPSSCGRTAISSSDLMINPALTGSYDSNSISINFAPLRFGMKELSPAMISCAFRLNGDISSGGFISGIGNNIYNEFSAGISGSVRISEFFTAGGRFSFSRLGIKDYKTEYAHDLDVGGIFYISQFISAGFAFSNITGSCYKGGDKTVNQKVIAGIGLKPSDDLFLDIDLAFSLSSQAGVSIAGRYDILDILRLRLALLTNPRSLESGVAIRILPNMSVTAGLHYHDVLGFSQVGGVEFEW